MKMTNVSRLQILPCGTTLTVKVFKHKLLQTTVEVYRPTVIRLGALSYVPGDKYLIKVAPSNGLEFRRSQMISLTISTAQQFAQLPDMPSNTAVEDIPGKSTCKTAWILWRSSPDTRSIRYLTIDWFACWSQFL